MDTPVKATQIATPLSKFEDSPVFNYINSLSPIKPVKSLPITQTFNSLNFTSLSSIFTSPHVSNQKETRLLRRNNCSDPSKPEFSSGNKVYMNDGVANEASQLYDNSAELKENFDPGISIEELSVEASSYSKIAIELPRALKYDCGSPGCDPKSCSIETNCMSEVASTSISVVQFVQEPSDNGSSEAEGHLQGTCQMDPKKEVAGCDGDSLISDAAGSLIFSFPNDSEDFKGLMQKSLDPGARYASVRFSQNDINGDSKMEMIEPLDSDHQHQMEHQSTQPGETSILNEINQAQDLPLIDDLDECLTFDPSENVVVAVGMSNPVAYKPVSNLHHGMIRRCLDFELVARRKNLDDGLNYVTSVISQSDEKIASAEKQLVPLKPSSDFPWSIVPGIGLHLNVLATTSQDNKNIDSLSYGRQLHLPGANASFQNNEDRLHESFSSASTERDIIAVENVSLAEDASQTSAYLAGEEYNLNSLKNKRRRLENAEESEACKRCNCKKSKCLKLYCECFAAGVYCIEPCSCQDCFNKPIHEDTVLVTRKQIKSRNPLAFAPKVIWSSESLPETGEDTSKTPVSARHKRGCNCKKSSCLKKYCECYQGAVGCSINCRCEECKNTFGKKNGPASMETDAEPEEEEEEEETDTRKKGGMDKNLEKTGFLNNEEQNPVPALPTTPLRLSRPLVQLPFSSKCKPPRSSHSIGSSSGFFTSHNYGKRNILRSQPPKFEKSLQTTPEKEIPEILWGNSTPRSGTKTSSPNSKRVSPPLTILGSSPSLRSGQKLILRSIPSFPSLTPKH